MSLDPFQWIKRSAIKGHAAERGGRLEFRMHVAMRILIAFTLTIYVMILALLLGVAAEDPAGLFFVPLICVAVLVAALSQVPAPVTLDKTGIVQHYWWRRDKTIPWSELVEIYHDPKKLCTEVRAKWGTCIVFSPYLVGQNQFRRAVRAHRDLREISEIN
jgi:hypothetical protein